MMAIKLTRLIKPKKTTSGGLAYRQVENPMIHDKACKFAKM